MQLEGKSEHRVALTNCMCCRLILTVPTTTSCCEQEIRHVVAATISVTLAFRLHKTPESAATPKGDQELTGVGKTKPSNRLERWKEGGRREGGGRGGGLTLISSCHTFSHLFSGTAAEMFAFRKGCWHFLPSYPPRFSSLHSFFILLALFLPWMWPNSLSLGPRLGFLPPTHCVTCSH